MIPHMTLESLFGTIAFITSIIGLLPQSYKALKTRSTDDVSMFMLINYLACSVAWVAYGMCIHSAFVLLSNAFCALSSFVLMLQKIYYDRLSTAY